MTVDWTGAFGATTTDLTFTYDGVAKTITGTGGLALSNIQSFEIISGTGNDSVRITGDLDTYGSPNQYILHGGAGTDTLTYDNAPHAYGALLVPDNNGGFYGTINNGVTLDHFERLNITLGDADGGAHIFTSPLALGAKITIDAGSGKDYLIIHDYTRDQVTIFDATNVNIVTNIPNLTLTHFETYAVYLGNGSNIVSLAGGSDEMDGGSGNDTLFGGGGNDSIHGEQGSNSLMGGEGNDRLWSTGTDTIDGGGGRDEWNGNYSYKTTNQMVTYDGSTGIGVLSGGITFKNIEYPSLWLGSGNDSVTVTHAGASAGSYGGGGGIDSFTASDIYSAQEVSIGSGDVDELNGAYANTFLADFGGTQNADGTWNTDSGFGGFHDVNLSWGSEDDQTKVNTRPLSLGAHLTIDGGAGFDRLEVDFTIFRSVTFSAGTSVTTSVAGLKALNYEAYILHLGDGGNNVTAGDRGDALYGGTGNDTLDGGGGLDTIQGGGGDDALMIGYGGSADGGAGIDTLRLSLAGLTHGIDFDTSGIVSGQPFTLGGGVIQNIETLLSLRGSEFADTLRLATQSSVLTVDGGAGDDTVISQWSSVSVSGGAGDDRFVSGAAADTFNGGAGNDTVDYSAGAVGQWVDLRINAGSGGDSLIDVESVVGSAFADTITGNDSANTIDGGAGDDVLDAAGGVDTASYASATAGVVVSLGKQGAAQATQGAGSDTLKGFENLTGSAFNDQLNGDGFDNVLSGGAGNDTLEGGAGNDVLDGGAGVNTLSYYHATAGVSVDLTVSGPQNTGGMGVDTLLNLQNISGSAFSDTLRAGAGAHSVAAFGGADLVYIDNGASGSYDGGADIDTLSFAKATQGVTASLAVTTAQATGIGSMTFLNFEAVVGSAYADSLTGSALANTLTGGGGADTLTGGAGVDVFRYLQAADSTVAATDRINDFQHGIDKINLTAVRTGSADKYAISTVGENTQLDVDLHGDGSVDMRILLVGKGVLTSSDLVW